MAVVMLGLPCLRSCFGLVVCALAASWLAQPLRAEERRTLNFNPDWKFSRSDPAGAEKVEFDDQEWVSVSTPHTFNDIDTFDNWSTPGHRGEQIQWSGRTWYRKHFTAPAAWKGKKIFIEFEGVRQIADIYLNGHPLGTSKTGFTPFGFDLTPHVNFGGPNILAVMVDNRFMKDPPEEKAAPAPADGSSKLPGPPILDTDLNRLSAETNEAIPEKIEDLKADQIPWNNPHWHPAHGGIYRNVKLHLTDPLHIGLPLYSFLHSTGPYVYATQISEDAATITLEVPVHNGRPTQQRVVLRAEVLDANLKPILLLQGEQSIGAAADSTFRVSGSLPKPRLWEPAYPYVYEVRCQLSVGGERVDTTQLPLGIRVVQWDAAKGLILNGSPLKLHGWLQKPTDEWPGLGAAFPDWMHQYTMQMMKAVGGNFVRWGHAAAGPAQIETGDRLGIIADQPGVDGESDTVHAAWILREAAFRDALIYYRNNPSILIWEGGNQKVTREHAKSLRTLMDTYDPNGGRAYAHRRADAIIAEFMDVGIGTEGGREIANLPVVEGEYNREESPRRVWDNFTPPNFGYPEAKGQTYQLTSEEFAINQIGQYLKKLGSPEHSGGANWIFSDTTSGGRVAVEVAATGGEVDGVRLPKEAYWVCQALFSDEPCVHVIGHWTYPAGTKKNVYVVSNAEDVELRLNGRSLGHGQRSQTFLFTFRDLTWESGELQAIASTKSETVAEEAKHTAGPAAALRLTPRFGPDGLRADGADIALIDVEAVDANGERCPTFQGRVDFETTGPAVWRGGYNSGKLDSINHPYLDLEAGVNRVAVRTTRSAGEIKVRARSKGLNAGETAISSRAVVVQSGYTEQLPARIATILPPEAPQRHVASSAERPKEIPPSVPQALLGRFVKAFNYSGPSGSAVHVEKSAKPAAKAFIDDNSIFGALPQELVGADWIQAANKESGYSAVDLMEITAVQGSTVWIALDARLKAPTWLLPQFERTELSFVVNSQKMTLFRRVLKKEDSLTLGTNGAFAGSAPANMYIVFVNAPDKP